MRIDTPHNEEMRINTVVCYHCRENIEGTPTTTMIDGHQVQICANCDEPHDAPHVSLMTRLQNLIQMMTALERERGGPSSLELITARMSEAYPDQGWTGGFTRRLIETAMRDGTIFSPTPGTYKVV